MLNCLLSPENLGGNYQKFNRLVLSGQRIAAYGLPTPVKYILTGFLRAKTLYVTRNKVEADSAVKNFIGLGKKTVYLPPKPEVLISASSFSLGLISERFKAIEDIVFNSPDIIVATVEAISGLFPDAILYKERSFELAVDDEISTELLSKKLVKCGFSRKEQAFSAGAFSVRGDIVDVVLSSGEAVRLDFFGDTLERIKTVDLESMRSISDLKKVLITPVTDVLYDEEREDKIKQEALKNFPKAVNREAKERLNRLKDELMASLNLGVSDRSEFLPFTEYSTIFDYLDTETVVVFDEFNRIYDIASSHYFEHTSRYTALLEKGDVLLSQIRQQYEFDKILEFTRSFRSASLNEISMTDKGYKAEALISFKATPVTSYPDGNDELKRDINNWLKTGYRVVIAGDTEETAEKLSYDISMDGGLTSYQKDSDAEIKGCVVVPAFFEHGFILHENKIALIGTYDVFKKVTRKLNVKHKKTDAFLAVEVGDYVVHELHGIGKLKSVSTVKTGDIVRDYAIVEYKGGDVLYVPADQMDSLVKFSGSEKRPTLSKIGGKEFEKVKERVKASIREMAINLKELYATRSHKDGFAFQEDTAFQKEFEDAFPYDETPDQLTAIQEIKNDMISGKVMDRLLVGDVGFGKTEVAFRAAFKAIESGKQVCLLAPTTILCYQHFKTAVERFKGFGIRIDYLNRFKSDGEIKATLKSLAEGKIDFIISTHRVLSEDVKFADLGFLILDEEQRFGVEDKEKIKALKSDIDVLSMSATPIPRTLHMSLTGIRDISTIETPPSKRIPPEVIVTEETEGVLADALTRELARGGQAFVLYNRVNDIYTFAAKIGRLIPNAKIIVAHGQMNTSVLEQSVEKFVLGEYDILVTTTIIENGIDIPRANTMIVIDSDKFGLSTAYQLKGRVGRSDKLAYVYFTYKENKVLSENAFKRLTAIREFTEFGSGFKIAMRDLEIRGSGNVLGREQHGHMEKVGYDMYCKLLNETKNELEGKVTEDFTTDIDIEITAYIPEDYVALSSARLDLYSSIARISTEKKMEDMIRGIEDIYGVLPSVVVNLCKVALLKSRLEKLHVKRFLINGKRTELELTLDSMKDGEFLSIIEKNRKVCTLEIKDKILLRFNGVSGESAFERVFDLISTVFIAKLT